MTRLTVLVLIVSLHSGCASLRNPPEPSKAEPAAPAEIPQRIGTAVKCAVAGPVGGMAGGLMVGVMAPPAVFLTVPVGGVIGAVHGVAGALRALFEGDRSCDWQPQARR